MGRRRRGSQKSWMSRHMVTMPMTTAAEKMTLEDFDSLATRMARQVDLSPIALALALLKARQEDLTSLANVGIIAWLVRWHLS